MDVNSIIQQIQEASLHPTNIYIAIAVVVITSVLLWIIVRSSVSGDTVVLLGLCDSGKTLLFSLLTQKKSISTQTSINVNKGRCVTSSGKGGKSWKVVDVPGHERVRAKHLHSNKDKARGVIFMIDSVNFPREIRDVAENNLRQTRSAALLGIDDYSSSKNAFIGKQGKDFEFTHVHPIKVDFCECSLKGENGEKAKMDEVEAWLTSL